MPNESFRFGSFTQNHSLLLPERRRHVLLTVEVLRFNREAALLRHILDLLDGELVGLLDKDGFALLELETFSGCLDRDGLVNAADEGVLNTALIGIDVAVVEELTQVELAAKLSVYASQDIHVEVVTESIWVIVTLKDRLVVLVGQIEQREQEVRGLHR